MSVERRFAPAEYRAETGRVEGIVIRYGDLARLPGFKEQILPAAFGNVASADILANVQHERSRPLGRTNGGGLSLSDSEIELRAELELPPTQDGRDAAELLRRRVLRGFSVEFRVAQDRYDAGVRLIERATLLGIALVDSPAYGQSLATIAERAAASLHPVRRRVWL